MTALLKTLSLHIALCFSLVVLPACKTTPIAKESSLNSKSETTIAGACAQFILMGGFVAAMALGMTPSCQTKHATHEPIDIDDPVFVPLPEESQGKIRNSFKRGYYPMPNLPEKDELDDMVQVRIDSWKSLRLAIDLFQSFWISGEELKANYPKAEGNIDPKAKYLNFSYKRTDMLNLGIWEWDWNEISADNVKFDTANLNNAGGSVLINRTVLDTGSPFALNDSTVQLNISYAMPDPNNESNWVPGKIKFGASEFPHFFNYFEHIVDLISGDAQAVLNDIVAQELGDEDFSINSHLYKDMSNFVGDSKDDLVLVLKPHQIFGAADLTDAVVVVFENITENGSSEVVFDPRPYQGIIKGFFTLGSHNVDMEDFFKDQNGRADLVHRKRVPYRSQEHMQFSRLMRVDEANRKLEFNLHKLSKEKTIRFGGISVDPRTWGTYKQDTYNAVVGSGEADSSESPADISTFGLKGSTWGSVHHRLDASEIKKSH